jgi:lysophospholipase L1-like esterase
MRHYSTSVLLISLMGACLPLACSDTEGDADGGAPGGSSSAGTAGAGSAGKAGAGGSSAGSTAGGGAGTQGGTAGTSAGKAGSAGSSAGTAGVGGGAGAGGAGGTAGAGGAGTGGAGAGAGGTAGAFGGAGAGGASGAGGVSGGASGANGSAGSAGVAGTSGMGGASGAAGAGGGTSFMPCPTNGDPCVILPFGDSITDGFNIPGGYRIELFSQALEDDHDITFVGGNMNGPNDVDGTPFPRRHEGHSGWRISQLHDRIPNPAFQTTPHIVLLMIGTNDCIQNDNLSQAPARLETLLDEIIETAPDALVVVAQLTPLTNNGGRVTTYNAALPAIVEERATAGKHVMLVDQHTGFPGNGLADGIHPNEAGYAYMAGVWYDAIEPLLP